MPPTNILRGAVWYEPVVFLNRVTNEVSIVRSMNFSAFDLVFASIHSLVTAFVLILVPTDISYFLSITMKNFVLARGQDSFSFVRPQPDQIFHISFLFLAKE